MEHDYDHNKPLVSKKGCNSENFGNVVPNIPTSDDEGDDDGEIGEINNVGDFFREFGKESRKLWYLAAPSILTSVFQYAFGALTQIFSGHLSTGELAAISMETSVISSLGYGLLMGMGSAVETLCGQAYGAKHVDKLGIYLQKSWIILNTAAIGIVFYFLLTTPLLNLLGQDPELSAQAGKFAVMMIPQQFAYAFAIPLAKFLQAQSKVFEMAGIAGIAVCFHALVGWIFMMKLRWGLFGAALALNSSWWLVAIGQFLYVVCGFCGRAWSGFSWKAFSNLSEFVKLSISSAIMFCLEIWYLMALTLVAGYLPNPEISVAALSITRNINGWSAMVGLGFNVAVSVRVSNKLGSGHPRAAKLSVIVVGLTALVFGLIFALVLLFERKRFPALFTDDLEIQKLVEDLTPLLGATVIFNCLQNALCGVAIGAGWQNFVAYINAACYFFLGVPASVILGIKFAMGVKGIWYGLLLGLFLQAATLFVVAWKRNWKTEANIAQARLKQWGGED